MDNIELLKVFQEIHINYSGGCSKCPLSNDNTKCKKILCNYSDIGDNAEEVVKICEQWRKDNPIKTYADVFKLWLQPYPKDNK